MQWNPLSSLNDLQGIVELSNSRPQVIFKHSTTCPISSMAKMRVEDKWDKIDKNIDFHYLDLLSFRNISNQIAETFEVHHESPQFLVIRNGHCVYDASHLGITVDELKECYQDTF